MACDLLTCKCCVACAATCGKCVITSTCRSAPNCLSNCPTTSATPPPMPTSTSSKIMHGTKFWLAVVTCKAKLMRESSPPEATLFNALGSMPEWPATKNSTVSKPLVLASQAFKATENLPPLKDNRCISALIFWLKVLAAA